MVNIIGVRFKKNGKIYSFDPTGFDIRNGCDVIVETARGQEFGKVVLGPKEISEKRITMPLKPIIRIADDRDRQTVEENKQSAKEAFDICLEKIAKHQLNMKLIDSEYTFDRSKLLFYFTSDKRVDFRELVKDLASIFRTRIELRQIGVRDEAKMVGGYGICGRPLCCTSFLSEFSTVSIKMAKDQSLSLNPSKISGSCGRLMCCLKNEEEAYEYLNSKLPPIGSVVKTLDGFTGEVQSLSVLKQNVRVIIETDNGDKEVRDLPVDELTIIGRRRRGPQQPIQVNTEEVDESSLKELENMEKADLNELSESEEDDDLAPAGNTRRDDSRKGRRNYSRNVQDQDGRRDHNGNDKEYQRNNRSHNSSGADRYSNNSEKGSYNRNNHRRSRQDNNRRKKNNYVSDGTHAHRDSRAGKKFDADEES